MWLVAAVLLGLTACGQRTLLSDDFSRPNPGWLLEGDAFSRAYIAGEQLVIEVNEANTLHYVTLSERQWVDLAVEVDARLVTGSAGSSSYGLLFRQNGSRFYRFEVSPSGVFNVEKRNADGSWQRLLPSGRWEYSAAIRTEPNAINRLRVAVSGSIAVFSINGTVVQRIDPFDAELAGGTIALNAGSYARGGVGVAFDNLLITTP